MKKSKFYLRVKKGGKEREAIITASNMSNVINSFKQHNIPVLEHFQVSDDVETVEQAKAEVKMVTPTTIH